MEKRILKKIAKEWASGILYHGTGTDSFHDTLLTLEEAEYVVEQVRKIAKVLMITLDESTPANTLENIVSKYYTAESDPPKQ